MATVDKSGRERLVSILAEGLAAGTPAPSLYARLSAEATDRSEIDAALSRAASDRTSDKGRLADLHALHRTRPDAHAVIRAVLGAVPHESSPADPQAAIRHWAERFDRAAAISPEASVALHSLGDADRLEQATREIVAALRSRGLIGAGTRLLDLGCGTGRLAHALGSDIASYLGLDVSERMIDIARSRGGHLARTRFEVRAAHQLDRLDAGSFDLAVALDSFPYVVAAGLAADTLRAIGRVLEPGGTVAIFNLAYGCREADEVRTAGALAGDTGFDLIEAAAGLFESWDGRLIRLRRR